MSLPHKGPQLGDGGLLGEALPTLQTSPPSSSETLSCLSQPTCPASAPKSLPGLCCTLSLPALGSQLEWPTPLPPFPLSGQVPRSLQGQPSCAHGEAFPHHPGPGVLAICPSAPPPQCPARPSTKQVLRNTFVRVFISALVIPPEHLLSPCSVRHGRAQQQRSCLCGAQCPGG